MAHKTTRANASKDAANGLVVTVTGKTISGPQSGNYTLTQQSGLSANITPKALTVSGLTASAKVYDGTTTATLGGTAALQAAEAPGAGTTADGKPYTGDTVTLGGTPVGTFVSKNVGAPVSVTVTGNTIGGAQAGNYSLTQQTGLSANITALAVQLSGTRVYDGTTLASSGILTIANNLDGANLTLSGNGGLASKDVGSPAISAAVTPVRVSSAASGSSGAVTSLGVTVAAPADGNTLVAVITTSGTTTGQVSSITQTGATWTRAAQAANAAGVTASIWYATNLSGAGTAITINLASSLRAAAVVAEYSGVLAASPVDQTANSTNNSASPVTGTTATTTQGSEVWVGGIAFINNSITLGSILNSFSSVANTSSSGGNANVNIGVYALDKIVSATGAASSGGTLSSASQWAGALATFKAPSLALGGSAAGNYTLSGLSGSVAITAKALTTSGFTANDKVYDGTTTAILSGSAALQAAEAPGTGTTADGKPYNVDSVSAGGTGAGAFLLAACARMALGRQRPSSESPCPVGQGLLQTSPGWASTNVRRISSGSSTGSVALTRSVKAFMALRVAGVQAPLSSPP